MLVTLLTAAAKLDTLNLDGTARIATATTASHAALFHGTLFRASRRRRTLELKSCFTITTPPSLLPRTVKRGLRSRHLCRGPNGFMAFKACAAERLQFVQRPCCTSLPSTGASPVTSPLHIFPA
jgi:hypothetical protein